LGVKKRENVHFIQDMPVPVANDETALLTDFANCFN